MIIEADIPGYEGLYKVSNYGLVRSLDRVDLRGRRLVGKVMSLSISGNGYLNTALSSGGVSKTRHVHQLVAEAFCMNHFDGAVVNHIDGDRLNNKAWNLEYITNQYNVELGRSRSYEYISPTGVRYVETNNRKFCRKHGLNHSLMSQVAKGLRNHHKGWLCIEVT